MLSLGAVAEVAVDMEMPPEVWAATQSLVPVAEAEAEARGQVVLRGPEVPGVPMAQAGVVVRQAHKPERQGPMLMVLAPMVAGMAAGVEVVIQVPALEEQEPQAVRLGAVAEAEGHLILALVARPAQAQVARHEFIHGR